MSAHAVLHEAVVAALRAHAPLSEALTAVFDAPPVRSALPHAVVAEAVLTDWGAKDAEGREGRIAVALHDDGERPVRLRALMGEVEAAVAAMPREPGEGWRVASLVPLRSRITGQGERRWMGVSEFRVRMLRTGA